MSRFAQGAKGRFNMKVIAIIPARLASTRFPGKPLADILGLPMIEHIRRRVKRCSLISDVIVATCDQEIFDVVTSYGGKAAMTAKTHERGTDRIAEVAMSLHADVFINVQGDEPLVDPEMLGLLLDPLSSNNDLQCTNLMTEITDDEEFNNPNVVKAVCDNQGKALYFSREPIPSVLKAGKMQFKKFKQLGIYAFRSAFLQLFTKLSPTLLAQIESVDMLRAVEHGYIVKMVQSPFKVIGVDTPDDLQRVLPLMKKDKLFPLYQEKIR